jgi:predicted nucleic acid-binding protein
MILVDTSVWIDHLYRGEPLLVDALNSASALAHPMVVGELSLGTLTDRTTVLRLLNDLPVPTQATHAEVMEMVERGRLHGRGLGLVDAHILASALLTARTRLWTRDRWLREAAAAIGAANFDEG